MILVDCTERESNADLKQQYEISGYPTVVAVAPDGTLIEKIVGARDGPYWQEFFTRIATEHGGGGSLFEGSVADAVAAARERGRLLVTVFVQEDDERSVAAVEEAMEDDALEPLFEQFLWVRRPLRDDRNRTTDEAREWDAGRSGMAVIIDPWAEGEQNAVLSRVNNIGRLVSALEDAIEEARERAHPPQE